MAFQKLSFEKPLSRLAKAARKVKKEHRGRTVKGTLLGNGRKVRAAGKGGDGILVPSPPSKENVVLPTSSRSE